MDKTFQVYFLSIISLFFWLPLAVLVMLYAVIARWHQVRFPNPIVTGSWGT